MFRCSASLYFDEGFELPSLVADYLFPFGVIRAFFEYLPHWAVWLCLGLVVEVSQYILHYVGFIV